MAQVGDDVEWFDFKTQRIKRGCVSAVSQWCSQVMVRGEDDENHVVISSDLTVLDAGIDDGAAYDAH